MVIGIIINFVSHIFTLKLFLFLALLKSADLTKTSAKKIRQELEKKLDTDLDDR